MNSLRQKQGFVTLVIFLMTQMTWSFNNCPSCLERSLSFVYNKTTIENNGSCCAAKKAETPPACSTCKDDCRCSSLETFDDVEAVVGTVINLEVEENEQLYTASFSALFPMFYNANLKSKIENSPPLPHSGYLYFPSNVLRI